MQDKNTISLIPDSISYAAVQEFLAQRLEANRASIRIQNRVQVVADEIWSNIVRYSGAAQASLELRREKAALLLCFTDNGKPYDPTTAPEPDTSLPADERTIGGMGLYMVRKMTTSMRYRYCDARNILAVEFAWT